MSLLYKRTEYGKGQFQVQSTSGQNVAGGKQQISEYYLYENVMVFFAVVHTRERNVAMKVL
jgi:hypothetical protein